MKKLALVLSLLAICCFAMGACGGNGDNDCEKAGKLMIQGMDEACSGKDAECCFCKCWNDGHKTYDFAAYGTDGTCTCVAGGNGGSTECTGEDLDAAKACLAESAACKAAAGAMVTDATTGMCTLTPLQ